MLDTIAVVEAVRSGLLSLSFAQAGIVPMPGEGNTYTRANGGSFTDDDGFKLGMEVVVVPEAGAEVAILGSVKEVSAMELMIDPYVVTVQEVKDLLSDYDKTEALIRAQLPFLRNWTNIRIKTNPGKQWHIEEDFIPGPSRNITVGSPAETEHYPMYVLRLFAIPDIGHEAMFFVADQIMAQFKPRKSIGNINGRSITVRSDPAPFRGPAINVGLGNLAPGVAITIPLIVRLPNTLD